MSEAINQNQSSPVMGRLDLPVALPFIVDEIPLGIAVMDTERRVVLLNRAMEALTGFDREAARAVGCRHIVRGDICLANCPALNMSHGPGTMCVEGNIVNCERQKIPVRITFTPIKDQQGNVIGFFETVEDIRMLRALAGETAGAYTFGQIVG